MDLIIITNINLKI